ncbi:MAG: alpha-L-fucosidase [Acidobacteriota bacterium]
MRRREFLGAGLLAAQAKTPAPLEWFKQAKFGLFMHYGLYSLLGRGEWVMQRERIPVAEYEKLKLKFTAGKFDAGFIANLAVEAGMKYVNITSRHHDSFCLFRTKETNYNSVESLARRDLVGELAKACRKRGLGLFLYYSYAADWRHPYFMPREGGWQNARPAYEKPEPSYLFRKDEDFRHYIRFVHNQLRELLTQYGEIRGIWLDPIAGYYARPDLFPIAETYALIRKLQPACLISFKQGANGDEDFVAPERKVAAHTFPAEVARIAWERNRGKPAEICATLQARVWGYSQAEDGKHKTADEVMAMLKDAEAQGANLLLNTGPLGDGSIPREDVATLREVGRRLREL